MSENCLIIGYGSIGERHARLLKKLGHRVWIMTQRHAPGWETFPDIESGLKEVDFQYAVVCNRTSEHYDSLMTLANLGFEGRVLVEKPVFSRVEPFCALPFKVFVAYNLRFHPIIKALHDMVSGVTLYSVQVYCGQYLPDWRPGRDYTRSYSASGKMGGGVLRDLSHELDYLTWMVGPWRSVAAKGGRVSDLAIDSDDIFCLILETENCPVVSLQVNYLDLMPKREIIINGKGLALKADLIYNRLWMGGDYTQYKLHKNETYLAQHRAALNFDEDVICSYGEGLDTLELIEAAEKASKGRLWITR